MIRHRTDQAMSGRPATVPVGIGGVAVGCAGDGVLAAYALGSCVGIVMWAANAMVGGLAHIQLPSSVGCDPRLLSEQPGRFADIGLNDLLRQMEAAHADRRNLRVVIVGGARIGSGGDPFAIGARNIAAVRKWLWSRRLLCAAEDLGGETPRTVRLDLADGTTQVTCGGRTYEL